VKTGTGKKETFAKDLAKSWILLPLLGLILSSCKENTFEKLKNYQKNKAPVIESFTGSPTGVALSPGLQFTLTVTAYDPDENEITYEYSAVMGSFANQQDSETGSTVTYILPASMTAGTIPYVTVKVKDKKNASVSATLKIGEPKSGPLLTQTTALVLTLKYRPTQ